MNDQLPTPPEDEQPHEPWRPEQPAQPEPEASTAAEPAAPAQPQQPWYSATEPNTAPATPAPASPFQPGADAASVPAAADATVPDMPAAEAPQTPEPAQAPQAGAEQAPAASWSSADQQHAQTTPTQSYPAGYGTPGYDGSGYGTQGYNAPGYGTPGYDSSAQSGAPVAPGTPGAPGTRTKEKKSGPGWGAMIGAMVATAALTVGGLWGVNALTGNGSSTPTSSSLSSSNTAQSTTPSVASTGDAPDWEAVAAAVRPATVSITASSQSASGVGSGVIYDDQGHIITNYHVISTALNGGQIQVTLSDGRLYTAQVVGTDSSTDLAVIKLDDPPENLTVAKFGDSNQVKVGQDVMAIGSPLGLSDTATTGIVSALNRPVEVEQEQQGQQQQQIDPNDPFGQLPGLQGFGQQQQQQAQTETVVTNSIQVDASINPGNSGGPLFDATGAVIGINSSIASNTTSQDEAGSIGLGFAIPSDLVKSVAQQLIETGKVDHAVLGVSIKSNTTTVEDGTRIGAEIAQINDGSAAAAAGMKTGDVILEVDGQPVSSAKQLTGYIRRYKGGDQVNLKFARDGKIQETQVTLNSQTS